MNNNKSNSNTPREYDIEKICCGLTHSGCLINGKIYIWG